MIIILRWRRLVTKQGRSVASAVRDIGIHENTMHKWFAAYKVHKDHAFPGSSKLRPKDEEIRQLKKRLADLEGGECNTKKSNGHLRKTPEIIYPFIHHHRFEFQVEKICQVLGVSRSGYYAWVGRPKSDRKKENEKLLEKIKQVHKQSRETYGSPRVTHALKNKGIQCSKNRVARLMKENNIAARTKRKFKATTNSKHNYPVAENIVNQNFNVSKPNQVKVADIAYIPTGKRWLYLAAVADLFHSKVIGWAMDSTMTRQLVIDALKQAIKRHNPPAGLIHHSDRGSQYACKEYQQTLKEHGLIASMSRKETATTTLAWSHFLAP